MKKISLSIVLIFCASMAQAQIQLNSNGCTGLQISPNNYYSLNINGVNRVAGIYCTREGSNNYGTTAIYGRAIHYNTDHSAGVKGFALNDTPQTSGICYGGFFGAGNGKQGYNYSVFGRLHYSTYGAAIYGTTNASDTGPYMNKRYAGYFNGDTYVNGNLTVTGQISGSLLTNAPTAGSVITISASIKDTNGSIINNLSGLSLSCYYSNGQTEDTVATDLLPQGDDILEANTVMSDSVVHTAVYSAPNPPNAIEKQSLSKQHYCLDAEQLEEVFPDLVYENEDGTKSINYVEMVPILVHALNEMNAKVAALESKDLEAKGTRSVGDENVGKTAENVTLLSLGENRPNPFSNITTIPVSIPADVQKAFIYVYDLTGKKVQQLDITARGKQQVTLNASSLTDGMYLYSLIADGKVVQTRRMIVEK